MTSPPTVVVHLTYPFRGRWLTQNSPARRVPSHGTHLMGTTYAVDFVPVDGRGRSAPRSWRAVVGTEPPDVFFGFGTEVLAPCAGQVVIAHDGETDHEARRSQLTLIPYLLSQARRVRQGPAGLAGNHIVISAGPSGPFILLAHLRRSSLAVSVGDEVESGQVIGQCGNSGNSTQPHVHIQATNSTAWDTALGLPLAFVHSRAPQMPQESEIVTI